MYRYSHRLAITHLVIYLNDQRLSVHFSVVNMLQEMINPLQILHIHMFTKIINADVLFVRN